MGLRRAAEGGGGALRLVCTRTPSILAPFVFRLTLADSQPC